MRNRRKIISFISIIAVTAVVVFSPVSMGHAEDADYSKPLLTIACLSDLHNQGPILTEDNAVMRGTIGNTIDQMMYDEENVDAVIVGGDVSSDNQTTEEKLYRILDMVQDKVSELTPNTLWITGNHDYNAGESEYNSADYYNRYTGPAMGMLTDNNIYIENYKGIDYVCGYHYVINGFDLICLCDSYETLEGGKQHYNYAYSDGTFDWLADTLDDIEYNRAKEDEQKPIFIIAHFPFRDSNSLSDVSKGMIEDSNQKMKDILSQHSNIYYLYGHDHAKDTAYIKTDTAQRVTEYDEYGNVMNPPKEVNQDDFNNDNLVWKFTEKDGGYVITNTGNGLNLGVQSNLTTLSDETVWNVNDNGNTFAVTKADDSEGNGVYYSTSSKTFSFGAAGKYTELTFYEKQINDGKISYVKADEFDASKEYVLVADTNKALSNTHQIRSDRMDPYEVEAGTDTITIPETSKEDDSDEAVFGKKSFTSIFMGSMRYYNNSIDGWVNENNSKVVQALMVYVYYDRIEFVMKNYGTQDAGSWELEPYVVEGQVMPFPTAVPTEIPTPAASEPPAQQSTNEPINIQNTSNAQPVKNDTVLVPKAIIKSCKKVNASKAAVTVKKLSGVKKYQIKVSNTRKFRKKGTVTKSFSGMKCTLKKLKKGKKYYIKVRACKTVNNKKVYGDWSSIKKIKM